MNRTVKRRAHRPAWLAANLAACHLTMELVNQHRELWPLLNRLTLDQGHIDWQGHTDWQAVLKVLLGQNG
jgi:hypothetical protein